MIDANSRIGANAVVVKDVQPDSVEVGVPGQVAVSSKPAPPDQEPGLEHSMLPDLFGVSRNGLMRQADEIEELIDDNRNNFHPALPGEGFWQGEDFST